ncbi:hypothetical protein FA13DRAFT_1649583, partial [Coprinellus micaceus]
PSFLTRPNAFRLMKRFSPNPPPKHDPDSLLTKFDLYDSTHHADSDDNPKKPSPYAPFPNLSSFELGDWFYGQGSQKSLKDFKALIDILTKPGFSLEDIQSTKWTRVFQDLGKNKEEINPKTSQWVDDAGWKATEVEIEVPLHNKTGGKGVERHIAGKLFHRNIMSIVEEKVMNTEDFRQFHRSGHELLWQPDPLKPSTHFRVMSELYHSDAFLEAEMEINQCTLPPAHKDCKHPRVLIGLMFWSDATHVSTFSTTKLWPLYMLFANESKYRRAKDGTDLCNHVAYFDAWEIILDDELIKAIVEGLVIKCCDGVLRRFFIRIFTYATDYPEKVLMATIKARGDCPCVQCLIQKKNLSQMGTPADMAFRKANPRVDDDARQERVSEARAAIKSGLAVAGDSVVKFLSHSEVPVENAFSKRLRKTGFNIFKSLTVDILHEFEIGVFKSLFIHLIRILDASAPGGTLIHELDRRRAARDYEDVLQLLFLNARWHALAKLRMQTEGTITLLEVVTPQLGDQYRQFATKTEKIHTLERPNEAGKRAKAANKKQGQKKGGTSHPPEATAPQVPILSLPSENRRPCPAPRQPVPMHLSSGNSYPSSPRPPVPVPSTLPSPSPRPSPINIPPRNLQFGTSNIHSSPMLAAVGPSPAVRSSTIPGAMLGREGGHGLRDHLMVPPTVPSHPWGGQVPVPLMANNRVHGSGHSRGGYYDRNSAFGAPFDMTAAPNNRTVGGGLANYSEVFAPPRTSGRPAAVANVAMPHGMAQAGSVVVRDSAPRPGFDMGASNVYPLQGEYFHKSPKAWTKQTSRRQLRMELSRHERRRKRLRTFVSSLKQHLLPRFIRLARPDLKDPALGAFVKSQDWSHLVLKNDRLYTHQILRLKYTTYDTRRDEDIIHLDTAQCNLMLHNPEYSYKSKTPKHPFRYCKVIAILHADVAYVGELGPRPFTHHRLDFLWVRWYDVLPASSEFQLDRAKLLPLNERGSHSFIDPSLALRACHMIPRFRKGMKHLDGKGTSELANDGSDWLEYYINRFVDRDMFMRYEWGLGVGHTYAHTNSLDAMKKILAPLPSSAKNARLGENPIQTAGVSRPAGGELEDTSGSHAQVEEGWLEGNAGDDGDDDDDDSSICTDATSLRGYSDAELEREVELFGKDIY